MSVRKTLARWDGRDRDYLKAAYRRHLDEPRLLASLTACLALEPL